MKRTKIIAIFIAFAIIISNCLPILNSIVYASPNKISTVFTANESDGTLSLKQDGKALIFTMNEVQYEISVREVQSIDPRVEDIKLVSILVIVDLTCASYDTPSAVMFATSTIPS